MTASAVTQQHPLEGLIGYTFKEPRLLEEALSHKSFASESKSSVYNERLEFLGDSVLSAVVAHELYVRYSSENEGSLSKRKALIVSRPSLAQRAVELNLGSYLYLGVGEDSSGGRQRHSLLANALEALIGAVYLDGGYEPAANFVRSWCLGPHAQAPEMDFKSRLQEFVQKKHKTPPVYETTQVMGPDHDRTFQVAVKLGRKVLGRGTGKNKKEAEQAAARHALSALESA